MKIKAVAFPFYIPGRCGEILFNGTKIGTIGEMHPEVVKNFELDYPTATFELNISPFIKWSEIK